MALGQKLEFKTFGVRLVQLVQIVFSLRKKVAVEHHAIRSELCKARRLLAAGAGPLIWLCHFGFPRTLGTGWWREDPRNLFDFNFSSS